MDRLLETDDFRQNGYRSAGGTGEKNRSRGGRSRSTATERGTRAAPRTLTEKRSAGIPTSRTYGVHGLTKGEKPSIVKGREEKRVKREIEAL